jgi:hypothetical protein
MIGNQLPDGFNFGATDIAPAITKIRLHDPRHGRSILERKPVVELFCDQACLASVENGLLCNLDW